MEVKKTMPRILVSKTNKEGDLSVTVLGETFNFKIIRGDGKVILLKKLREMKGWDKILMIIKMRNTQYEKKKEKYGKFWNKKPQQ
jgi:hypothetical protein